MDIGCDTHSPNGFTMLEAREHHQGHVMEDSACRSLQQNINLDKSQCTVQGATEEPRAWFTTSLSDVIGEDVVLTGLDDDMFSINSTVFDPPRELDNASNAVFSEKDRLQVDTTTTVTKDQVDNWAAMAAGHHRANPHTHSQGAIPCFISTQYNDLLNGAKIENFPNISQRHRPNETEQASEEKGEFCQRVQGFQASQMCD